MVFKFRKLEIRSREIFACPDRTSESKSEKAETMVALLLPPKQLKMANHFMRLSETYESTFPAMRLFAADAVSLAPPITASSVVHDNGCGPGIVSAEVLARCRDGPPPRIEATDISPAMASAACRRGPSVNSWVMDSRDLSGFDDGVFTHSFSAFVVLGMSTADGARVVSEMRRTLRPGGTAVLTAWAELGYVELFEEVARAVKPGAAVDTGEAVVGERRLRSILGLGGFMNSTTKPSPSPTSPPSTFRIRSSSAVNGSIRLRLSRVRSSTKLCESSSSSTSGTIVELRRITRSSPWALWTGPAYDAIRRNMCDNYTGQGWTRQDTHRLDEMLADRIRRLAEHDETYNMTAWVAVLRKS